MYYYDVVQRSERWSNLRKGRIGSSRFLEAAGRSPFSTQQKCYERYKGILIEEINEKMRRGIIEEENAILWFEQEFPELGKVQKIGIVISTFDDRLEASPDGLVGDDELIEIKSTSTLYPSLVVACIAKQFGTIFSPFDHSHIPETHYAQMQGALAITGRKRCHYVVYTYDNLHEIYHEIIPFNEKYWNELYKDIREFFDKYGIEEDEERER